MFNCNCNNFYNPFAHRLLTATATATAVELTVTNSTNIADETPFWFYANANIVSVPAEPLPVTIEINGTQIPLWNKYGVQILSNQIPRRARGYYSENDGTPHVILVDTPRQVILP